MPGPGAPPNAKIPSQPGGFGGAARGLYGGGLGGGGGVGGAFGGMDLLGGGGGGGGFGGGPAGGGMMQQFPFMVPTSPHTPLPVLPPLRRAAASATRGGGA
jgi:hypothetical protein